MVAPHTVVRSNRSRWAPRESPTSTSRKPRKEQIATILSASAESVPKWMGEKTEGERQRKKREKQKISGLRYCYIA